MDPDLAALRREYGGASSSLDEAEDPTALFVRWFADVRAAEVDEPNAMVLSTVGPTGPSSRTVLLKGLDERGFSFFTNHDSRKGHELAGSPRCALLFGWYALHRQVRVEGAAQMLPRDEVEEYFAQRPRGAQLGAWASRQSSTVTDRAELEAAFAAAEKRFEGLVIPPPPTWGGYVVDPDVIEFWQGRENRLHDRLLFARVEGGWTRRRLAP
ncbi:MAG TPA: pyridoxamine 5'-phosphate oxidase [Marmoricola sp.]|nr:pyridoxamine 5'-phosphate oxidase [Marmoricola sp.]